MTFSKLLTGKGRINRRTYATAFCIIIAYYFINAIIVGAIASLFVPPNQLENLFNSFLMDAALVIPPLLLLLRCTSLRLHDCDISGWLTILILFMPILYLIPLIHRPTPGPNNHGPSPDPSLMPQKPQPI